MIATASTRRDSGGRVARADGTRYCRGMSYTIKNLRDTDDKAPAFGLSEIGEAHFPREELGAESTGLAFLVLNPGMRQGFGHRHDQAEEVALVLAGGGRVRLGEEISRDLRARRDPPRAGHAACVRGRSAGHVAARRSVPTTRATASCSATSGRD